MAAIGGNPEAARLSGIRVEVVRLIGFVIVGLGAALAGIILTAQAQQYYANAATGYLLPAYAGVFLGAATLRANQFHILGTFIGVLFMQTIQTGLIIMNYSAYLANIIQGAILDRGRAAVAGRIAFPVRVAVQANTEIGESPSWDDRAGVLRFVDAHPGTIYRYDPADGSLTSCTVGQAVGAVVVRESGGIAAAVRDGIGLVDESTGALDLIAPIELDVPRATA